MAKQPFLVIVNAGVHRYEMLSISSYIFRVKNGHGKDGFTWGDRICLLTSTKRNPLALLMVMAMRGTSNNLLAHTTKNNRVLKHVFYLL